MGQAYKHFDLEERCAIARLHEGGQSLRQIAAALDRAPSSISRELKRNRGVQVGYKPSYAQDQAAARRWSGSRLENDPILQNIVLGCLSCGWSPEQVAGWLRRAATQRDDQLRKHLPVHLCPDAANPGRCLALLFATRKV